MPRTEALSLGHSPDPDDAFMFFALAENKINTRGWSFAHVLQDIQTLNERATRGELAISAISIHAYAHVLDKYALLPCGASMGDGYGPMLVVRQGGITDIDCNHASHWVCVGDYRGLICAAPSHQDFQTMLIATELVVTVRPKKRIGMTGIEPLPIAL